jgi:hypothetical protein
VPPTNGASTTSTATSPSGCGDWYAPGEPAEVPKGRIEDPLGPETGEERVIRGGHVASTREGLDARDHARPAEQAALVGFRWARSIDVPLAVKLRRVIPKGRGLLILPPELRDGMTRLERVSGHREDLPWDARTMPTARPNEESYEVVPFSGEGLLAPGIYRLPEERGYVAVREGLPTFVHPDARHVLISGRRFLLDAPVETRPYDAPGALSFYRESSEPPQSRARNVDDLRALVTTLVLMADDAADSTAGFDSGRDKGLTAHLLVDWDGVLLQPLDLDASATAIEGARYRAVAIVLNNLLAGPDDSPYPPTHPRAIEMGAPGARRPRPKEPMTINGKLDASYGFTEAQYRTLGSIGRLLVRVFERAPARFPVNEHGHLIEGKLADPDRFAGFAAHWHLGAYRSDPGAGFDWDRFRRELTTIPL